MSRVHVDGNDRLLCGISTQQVLQCKIVKLSTSLCFAIILLLLLTLFTTIVIIIVVLLDQPAPVWRATKPWDSATLLTGFYIALW